MKPKQKKKQGWMHGYPCRVKVGRGFNLGQWSIWPGAVRPKTPKTPKKSWMNRRMDGWMDGQTKQGRSTQL